MQINTHIKVIVDSQVVECVNCGYKDVASEWKLSKIKDGVRDRMSLTEDDFDVINKGCPKCGSKAFIEYNKPTC